MTSQSPQVGRARIDVDLDGCHGPQELPAFADIGHIFHRAPAMLKRPLQIREEVVVERLRGQVVIARSPAFQRREAAAYRAVRARFSRRLKSRTTGHSITK